MMQEIDQAANDWQRTKDPKYKDLWYKLIKEYVNGSYHFKRRVVSTSRSDERDDEGNNVVKQGKLF